MRPLLLPTDYDCMWQTQAHLPSLLLLIILFAGPSSVHHQITALELATNHPTQPSSALSQSILARSWARPFYTPTIPHLAIIRYHRVNQTTTLQPRFLAACCSVCHRAALVPRFCVDIPQVGGCLAFLLHLELLLVTYRHGVLGVGAIALSAPPARHVANVTR